MVKHSHENRNYFNYVTSILVASGCTATEKAGLVITGGRRVHG